MACPPVYHREAGQSRSDQRPGSVYLVRYQNSGVAVYWVRFSNACGSVAETFVFQAKMWSRTGCHRNGTCVVKNDASFVTALGFGLEMEALISESAVGLL